MLSEYPPKCPKCYSVMKTELGEVWCIFCDLGPHWRARKERDSFQKAIEETVRFWSSRQSSVPSIVQNKEHLNNKINCNKCRRTPGIFEVIFLTIDGQSWCWACSEREGLTNVQVSKEEAEPRAGQL